MDNLKPCPFCGQQPTTYSSGSNHGVDNLWIVCANQACRIAAFQRNTAEEAIAAWNHRYE